jgi:hypothetical protein
MKNVNGNSSKVAISPNLLYTVQYFLRATVCWNSFAYVAYFVFFWRDVWIRTQRAAVNRSVASRRAIYLATHLPLT